MTNEIMERNARASTYIARVAHRRARAERRKNRIAKLTLAVAIVLLLWAVSLAAVVAH